MPPWHPQEPKNLPPQHNINTHYNSSIVKSVILIL